MSCHRIIKLNQPTPSLNLLLLRFGSLLAEIYTRDTSIFKKKPSHPGMLLAGISAQIRPRLKTYRSDGQGN